MDGWIKNQKGSFNLNSIQWFLQLGNTLPVQLPQCESWLQPEGLAQPWAKTAKAQNKSWCFARRFRQFGRPRLKNVGSLHLYFSTRGAIVIHISFGVSENLSEEKWFENNRYDVTDATPPTRHHRRGRHRRERHRRERHRRKRLRRECLLRQPAALTSILSYLTIKRLRQSDF